MLIAQGSNINVMDQNGWTGMHYATKAGYTDVVKLFVSISAADYNNYIIRVQFGKTKYVRYGMNKDWGSGYGRLQYIRLSKNHARWVWIFFDPAYFFD